MIVQVGIEAISEFKTGHGTIGATAAALGTTQRVQKYVIVKADLGNTNNVFVGNSLVSTTDGFLLDAGEVTPPIYVDDLAKVWVVADAVGQGYSFLMV